MKKILNLLVCLCAITFSSIAQNSDFAKENTSKKEGNQRRIDRLLKEADSAFFYEYYFHAVGLYKNALQQGPAKNKLPKIYLKVATAQNRMNYPLDALPYLDFLWDENFYDREFLMLYGDVLLKCANYQKADIVFSLLYEQDSSNILVLNKLKSCQLGMNFKDEDMAFPSKKLIRQEKIQSNFSEYGLAFVNDQLIFSSTKVTSPKRIDSRTGQGFSHLYISPSFDRFNLQWNESRLLSENISSPDLNDGVFSYDESNKIGYFSRYTDGKWVIYTTKYNDDGTWAAPLPFIINKMDDNITHPAISPNGRHLIFAARAESGQGGADLWMTTYIAEPKTSAPAKKRTTKTTTPKKTPKKNASTKKTKVVEPQNKDWNIPVNLGSIINTSGNELFATWLNDNTIVYSSDGLPGYGGLDMYYSTMDSAGNFSEPLLLPPPINSSFDDYNMVIDKKINHGFFVSNRYTGPFYSDDIYAFPKSEGNIELNGLIVDNATGDPVPFSVVNITATPIVDSSITTCEYGKFALNIKNKINYTIRAHAAGYYDKIVLYTSNDNADILPITIKKYITIGLDKDTLEMQQSNVENLFANDNERMYPKETWEQGLTTAELADKANEKIRNSKNDIIPYIIASGKERCIVDILQYVNDNMTAQETIDVIDRYQCNDTSSKKNYAKTTTPSAETACETCSGKSKTRSKENFWIQTGDDKASLAIVDKNGKKSYIDLGPNNQHLVQINTVTSNDGPSLPTNVTMSDVSKTVVTKDYIMYECTPKLAELYNETYINNVYYDFNKTDIAKDGYRELDRMVVIALKNPDLMFEVASHADERGAEEYNQKLTDRRLKTVTDYITHKGFNIDRIVGKSYGKSQPLIKNAKTEEEHTLNRRTTFKLFIPNLKNELADKKYAIAESSPATKQTLHYRVQVGAYRTPVADPITVYNNLLTNAKGAELSYFLDSDGLYKYSFGIFNNLQDARSLCKLFLNLGTECYVAAYFNGNRITVNEAIMLSKHK